MKPKVSRIIHWGVWPLWLALGACGQAGESGAPTSPSPDAFPAVILTDAGTAGPRLGTQHPGWKQANCASCHLPARLKDVHGDPPPKQPTCVSCHGWNGAKHQNHAADPIAQCSSCHSEGAMATPHINLFAEPLECATCHVHPESLSGD